MAGQPWMKWYPSDWRSDPALRSCSLAARGLWIEMLGLMHEANPRGQLLIARTPPTDAQLAVLAGTTPDQIPDLLGELESAEVFSRTRSGVIYSRRMIRDEKSAQNARKNGKNGGNPSLCKQKGNPPPDNPPDKPTLKLRSQSPESRDKKDPPSSSSVPRSAARATSPPSEDDDDESEVVRSVIEKAGPDPDAPGWRTDRVAAAVERWTAQGLTVAECVDVVAAVRDRSADPPETPRYFNREMSRAAARKRSGGSAQVVKISEYEQRQRMAARVLKRSGEG